MILLHRFSSFAIAAVCGLSFLSLFFSWTHPLLTILLTAVIVAGLLGRLLNWQIKGFQFWHLLGTPLLFLLSSFGPFFLLENTFSKIGLTLLVVGLNFLFVEHVFSFVHLPIAYQPFTLEYLSQFLHILSVFFLSVLGFGLSLFLQTPLWFLTLVFFFMLFFIVYGTLWAGKVDAVRARPYAFAGAVLMSELFAVLSFLPTGFYSNAAFLALGVYVFLGLSRAHALHKLSQEVVRRYLIVFGVLAVLIAVTSQWI
jgi:hypothetical protein